jgi:thymidylate synthase (FAD)
LLRRGHESVLEHCQITVRLCCDRATSHQLVRHRLCAYSQESQRFVAYRQYLEVIQPPFANEAARQLWFSTVQSIAQAYQDLLESHERPENARALLPNCTATRLVMSANVRQWRHIFRERALNRRAQDQIRQLMHTLLEKLARHVPCLFEDLLSEETPSG